MDFRPAQRVNYDAIAHLFDEPGRDHGTDPNLARFLSERPTLHPAGMHILDMGCGTGKQLTSNRQVYPELVMVGLDLFQGMLQQARRRCPTAVWIQASSAEPPFKNNSFDYITNQFSYHHVLEKHKIIPATYRLLKPGGRFVMTNIDPWAMQNWVIYTYFPASRERDFEDFYPVEEFAALMQDAGFSNIQISRQHQNRRESLQQVYSYAAQRYRTSQLIAIRDSDYETGLARLKAELQIAGNGFEVDSELCLVTVTGDKG